MKSSVFKKENILKKIIMVSTNNTCRSFIAESILRQYLLDADQKNVEVISRGLVVLFPEPVHVKAADMVIKTCGIESLDFRSAAYAGRSRRKRSDLNHDRRAER